MRIEKSPPIIHVGMDHGKILQLNCFLKNDISPFVASLTFK
jgi:hypothetical protein